MIEGLPGIKAAKVVTVGPGQALIRVRSPGLFGLFYLPLMARTEAQKLANAAMAAGCLAIVKPSGIARVVVWLKRNGGQ